MDFKGFSFCGSLPDRTSMVLDERNAPLRAVENCGQCLLKGDLFNHDRKDNACDLSEFRLDSALLILRQTRTRAMSAIHLIVEVRYNTYSFDISNFLILHDPSA
jgi:hypothetical protein